MKHNSRRNTSTHLLFDIFCKWHNHTGGTQPQMFRISRETSLIKRRPEHRGMSECVAINHPVLCVMPNITNFGDSTFNGILKRRRYTQPVYATMCTFYFVWRGEWKFSDVYIFGRAIISDKSTTSRQPHGIHFRLPRYAARFGLCAMSCVKYAAWNSINRDLLCVSFGANFNSFPFDNYMRYRDHYSVGAQSCEIIAISGLDARSI